MILDFLFVFYIMVKCIFRITICGFGYLLIPLLIQFLVYQILDFSIYNKFKEIFINFNKFLDICY